MTHNSDPEGRLDSTAPLGKSVEEIEADNQNQHNPSVGGEHRKEHEFTPAVMPGQGGAAATGIAGSTLNPGVLVELDENGANNQRDNTDNEASR